MKHIVNIGLVYIFFMSSLYAQTVVIQPGLNLVGIANINKNPQYYQNLISLVNDNNTISPVVSELTNRFIQARMYNFINASTNQEIKFTQQELQDIEDKYKSIDETLSGIDDPFKILVTMFISLSGADPSQYTSLISIVANSIKTKFSTGIEVAIENSKTNPDFSQIKRTLSKAAMDAIIVPLMEIKPVKDYFEQHTIIKVFVENASAIIGDIFFELYNKWKGIALSQVIDEKIKLSSLEGIWSIVGAIDLWLKAATDFTKLLNLNSAIVLTQNVNVKMSVISYENAFINDFLFKYHSNLIEMYKVSDLGDQANAGDYFIDPANGINKTRPTTFYQLFVIYGITHGYLNNVDLKDQYNMYLLYTAAKQIQFFLKNYVGVNHSIYIDISDQTTAVTINPKTYQLQQLYWILPDGLNDKIENYMKNQSSYGNFYQLLFFENSPWSSFYLYNPFIASTEADISSHKLPYYYNSIASQQHVNVTYDKAELKEINGAGYLVLSNLQKTINWNGFLAEKGFDTFLQQHPKEKIQFDSVYIPFYRSNITETYVKRIVDKYVHSGILRADIIDMKKYLTYPVSSSDLLESCSKEDRIKNVFTDNVNDAFLSVAWTTPIRRQQFFQFLVKALKVDLNLYTYVYNNPMNNTSNCETIEGCALKSLGILSGTNPNGVLTMQQVLFTFENLEKYAERSKK